MKITLKAFAVLTVLAGSVAVAMPARAQVDEISVQGSSSTGGDAYTIRGRYYGELQFSVTGRFNDLAGVFINTGALFAERSIRDLWNGVVPGLQVVSRVQLPDGRSRVVLRVANAQPFFHGGRVRLRTGNVQFDSDPIQLY